MSLLLVASGSPPVTIVDDVDGSGSRAGAAFVALLAVFAPYADDPVPTAIAASIVDEQSQSPGAPVAWASVHAQGSDDEIARITVTDDDGRHPAPFADVARWIDPGADDVTIATIKDDASSVQSVSAPQISIPSAWADEEMATLVVATFVDEHGSIAICPPIQWASPTAIDVSDETAMFIDEHGTQDHQIVAYAWTAPAVDSDEISAPRIGDDDPRQSWLAVDAAIYPFAALVDDDDIVAALVDDDPHQPILTVDPVTSLWVTLPDDDIAAPRIDGDDPWWSPAIAPIDRQPDVHSAFDDSVITSLSEDWQAPWATIADGIQHALASYALDAGDTLPAPFRGEQLARESVTAHWIANWPTLQPSVPYTLDNESFEQAAAFARFGMVHTIRQQITAGPVGNRRFECRGYLFAQLFSAVNAGRAAMDALVDSARTVLEGARIAQTGSTEPVTTRSAAVNELGEDGARSMVVVTVPFVWFETR